MVPGISDVFSARDTKTVCKLVHQRLASQNMEHKLILGNFWKEMESAVGRLIAYIAAHCPAFGIEKGIWGQ